MREVVEEADVQTVKNKIDSMHGSFPKEWKKKYLPYIFNFKIIL